jgi:hypothetical protein
MESAAMRVQLLAANNLRLCLLAYPAVVPMSCVAPPSPMLPAFTDADCRASRAILALAD